MNTLRLVIVVTIFTLLVSCQASSDLVQRDSTAATSTQDVINAWNLHCVEFHFDRIPSPTATLMGYAYRGTDFQTDSDAFMSAIQSEVVCAAKVDPELDDTLNEVINSPVWYY